MSMVNSGDMRLDRALRPKMLSTFHGQKEMCENLRIYIDGARTRGEPLDHVLFHGPPGLGKTTLAEIISNELEVSFVSLSAPTVNRVGDLATVLVSLEPHSVLFIDEIHRLPIYIEEALYTVMEDYKLDVILGDHGEGKAITLNISPFTLVGATTRKGALSAPMLDRFGISLQLRYYTEDELCGIIATNCEKLAIAMDEDAIMEIARRSRGTPRVAGGILRRVRDFALAYKVDPVDRETVDRSLRRLGIDAQGLTDMDRRYLNCLHQVFGGGPAGIESLAATLSEDRETLEVSVEPYLLQEGLLKRTPRGRVLTDKYLDAYTEN